MYKITLNISTILSNLSEEEVFISSYKGNNKIAIKLIFSYKCHEFIYTGSFNDDGDMYLKDYGIWFKSDEFDKAEISEVR